MTRKRVLDITTRKKSDTRMTVTNARGANSDSPTTGIDALPALLRGNSDVYVIGHIATALPIYPGNSASNRTVETPYMRGYKERIRIETNTPHCWKWRRICFEHKGPTIIENSAAATWWADNNTVGSYRSANLVNSAGRTVLDERLFRGTFGVDYRSYMDAKIDYRQTSVKYDVTRTITSGNDKGVWKTFNLWHPMNKNLHYQGDENGPIWSFNRLASSGNAGMGDYYIVDLFKAQGGGTADDQMVVDYTSTLYWHEK